MLQIILLGFPSHWCWQTFESQFLVCLIFWWHEHLIASFGLECVKSVFEQPHIWDATYTHIFIYSPGFICSLDIKRCQVFVCIMCVIETLVKRWTNSIHSMRKSEKCSPLKYEEWKLQEKHSNLCMLWKTTTSWTTHIRRQKSYQLDA